MYTNELARLMIALIEMNGECSVTRLRMLIFICDWVALTRGKNRLTDLHWYNSESGPSSPQIDETISQHSEYFELRQVIYAGYQRRAIDVNPKLAAAELPIGIDAMEIAEFVVRITKAFDPTEFLRNVNGLYPVQTTQKYGAIDLEAKFVEYKRRKVEK